MEERKPLETKAREPSGQGRSPFLVPAQWDPHSWTELPWSPSSWLLSAGNGEGRHRLGAEPRTFMEWAAHCQGKVGQCPCHERSPWFFLPFIPCFRYPHPFPGSWILLFLNLDGFSPPATTHIKNQPSYSASAPHPAHHAKSKRG